MAIQRVRFGMVATLVACVLIQPHALSAQKDEDYDVFAGPLANPETREQAVADVVTYGSPPLQVLLRWIDQPPAGMNEAEKYQLYIGMADAFAELKPVEAIPFLIKNITLDRADRGGDIWLKDSTVVKNDLPAAAALIKIGPVAALPVIRAFNGRTTSAERMAEIFTVAMIKDPANRVFLEMVAGGGRAIADQAEEGIKWLDGQK